MKSTQREFVKRVRKLAETAEELRSGRQNFFFINRLVSIKSLCKDPQTAAKFVFFLAERNLERARSKPCPSNLSQDEWENCKRLMSEVVEAIGLHLRQSTEQTLAALRKLSVRLTALQPYGGERIRGVPVRTIRFWDALIVEQALDCILNPHEAAQIAYLTARDYAQKYNASYGTGLILESVPMLDDIIEFWSVHGLGDDEDGSEVLAEAPSSSKKTGARRGAAKGRQAKAGPLSKHARGNSIEQLWPVLAGWVRERGWIEIGRAEGSNSFIRVLDQGGLIWAGKSRHRSLDDAFDEAEKALGTWLEQDA